MSKGDFSVNIDWDQFIEDVNDEFDQFGKAAMIAVPRAINRTVAGVRTRVTKGIRERYNVKQKSLHGVMSVHKAALSTLEGKLDIKGSRISLHEFSPSPRFGSPAPKRGVSAVVYRPRGRVVRDGSFWADLPQRGRGIYRRKGEDRTPIIKLKGPSVPEMVQNNAIMETARIDAERLFYVNYRHEISKGHRYRKFSEGDLDG